MEIISRIQDTETSKPQCNLLSTKKTGWWRNLKHPSNKSQNHLNFQVSEDSTNIFQIDHAGSQHLHLQSTLSLPTPPLKAEIPWRLGIRIDLSELPMTWVPTFWLWRPAVQQDEAKSTLTLVISFTQKQKHLDLPALKKGGIWAPWEKQKISMKKIPLKNLTWYLVYYP